MLVRAAALALLAAAACAGEVAIRLEQGPRGAVFRVSGWQGAPADADKARDIFTVSVDRPGAPPLLGSYRVEGGTLVFEPRFPLEPGLRYRAVLHPTGTSATFELPKRPTAATFVEHVYPTAGRLPENQLKFYIHFSAPMSRGEAYQHVRLMDAAGREVALPFLELEQELWDPEGRRLTIFFDPGRVKRGLTPREEAGSPIEAGKSYTLIIDREWRDAAGNPLREEFRKAFRVGPADREPVDPKKWRVTPPVAGGNAALTVDFPEPMDHALAERLIEVVDRGGRAVAGSVEMEREETQWRFTPREAWRAGKYSLRVATTIEDLAGNKIGRPFEVDRFERVDRPGTAETVSLPFQVGAR